MKTSFLKTVSAYANYGTGEIKFGIDDHGQVVGIENPEETCLDIENRINDNISPRPDFSLDINRRTGVITLLVKEDLHNHIFISQRLRPRNNKNSLPHFLVKLVTIIMLQ